MKSICVSSCKQVNDLVTVQILQLNSPGILKVRKTDNLNLLIAASTVYVTC